MPETFSVERRRIIRFLGTKVVLTPAAQRLNAVVKAIELAKTHSWFPMRQFENEANPDVHGRVAAAQLRWFRGGSALRLQAACHGGSTPDFIPNLTGNAIDMRVTSRIIPVAHADCRSRGPQPA